jgi:GNAT superfamily N-acetyltransferase
MIRRMEQRDVARVIELGRAMHAESIYHACSFDPAKLEALGAAILAGSAIGPANLAAFVAESSAPPEDDEDPDEIIGLFVATCGPMWFGNDRVAGDLAFYVKPEMRGGWTAVLLVKQFEAWARGDAEAKWLAPGISTRIDHERVRDLYLKLGYRPFGERFLKEVV